MATVITKTIGSIATGAVADGDYPTLQAWEDACPPDLVAVDQIWRGHLLKGEHVYSTAPLTIGSATITSETCYIELTAAPGASFLDDAGLATNPLRYDGTKGAAIKFTGASGYALSVNAPYTKVSKIQVLGTGNTSSAGGAFTSSGTAAVGIDVNQCIFESAGRTLGTGTFATRGSGSKIRNSLVIQRSAVTSAVIAKLTEGASAVNTTFISIGTIVTNGIASQYAAGSLKNCYVGGATNPHDGGSTLNKTNCYSDVAATGFSLAPMDTTTFQNVTDGTHDFRTKTGSLLVDAGVTDVTTAATDVYGTSRPQGAAYDVGAYELPAAAVPPELAISWAEDNDTHAAVVDVEINGVAMSIDWTEGSDSHSVAATVDTASGQLTTAVILNNNGIARTNLAGCAINIYNATTGALVLRKTGLTTNAEGRLVVLDAALAKAANYAYEVDLTAAGGGLGRRLPVGTTV